jgi:hypothetical protein
VLVPTERRSVALADTMFTRLLSRLADADIELATLRIRVVNLLIATAAVSLASLMAVNASSLQLALVALGVPLGVFFVASAHPHAWVYSLLPSGWYMVDGAVARLRREQWLAPMMIATAGAGFVWLAYDARPQDGWAFVGVGLVLLLARHAVRASASRIAVSAAGLGSVVGTALVTMRVREFGGLGRLVDLGDTDRAWFHLVSSAPGALRDLVAGGNAIGSGDVPMPSIVGMLGVITLGVAVAANSRAVSRRASRALFLLVALLVYILWRQGDVGVSGRYIWVLAAIALTYYFLECRPGGVVIAEMPRTARRVIVASAGLANAFALHAHIRRYVTGSDVVGWNLNRDAEWWWPFGPAPMTTWLLGSAAFALAAGLVMFPARRPT